MSGTSEKRNYFSYPVNIKLKAIDDLEKERSSVQDIARELNVDCTTVNRWKKNKNELREWAQQFKQPPKSRKRLRKSKNQDVDKALWIWFREMRAMGTPISGPLIQAKAIQFHKKLGVMTEFKASNGWLSAWKNRYGIHSSKICGEKKSADEAAVNPFQEQFLKCIKSEELSIDQVFNCDETGLNYRAVPRTTLCNKSDQSPSGIKGFNDRITVMACSNVSGTFKLPLVVIGKSAKPRCLKNYRLQDLPVSYKSQNSAWMTRESFEKWFESEFVPSVKTFLNNAGLPENALLIIDNCSSHNSVQSVGNIKVMFFPPNTTSLIQPMDQNCLQTLKLLYREPMMNFISNSIKQGSTLSEAVKKITIKEAIMWICKAWQNVTMATIQKSWNRVWSWGDRAEQCEAYLRRNKQIQDLFIQFCQTISIYKNMNISNLQGWLSSTTLLTSDESLTDAEIIEMISEENYDDGNSYDEENSLSANNNINSEEIDQSPMMSQNDASLCFNFFFNYYKRHNYPPKIIDGLSLIKEEINEYESKRN